jgi:hypothetical protein
MQRGYSTVWDGYATDADAKYARDAEWRRFKRLGVKATRSVLRGQCRPYSGLGQPDGRVCDVYYITVYDRDGFADAGGFSPIEIRESVLA